MTITPVDSIVIPDRFMRVCANWHNGINCMLYAVSSTGNLTTGTIRPDDCDTDEQWYLTLWNELSVAIGYARRAAIEDKSEDVGIFDEFEGWVDAICDRLTREYGLDDWGRC